MGKLLFTIIAILLLNILPLAWAPYLYANIKTWILVVCAAALWLSQPAFKTAEAKANRRSDRGTILIILVASSFSVLAANIEWAYVGRQQNTFNAFTFLGLGMLLGGIAIRVWAIQTLGRHFTATATLHSGHQLVQSGLYKWVRHPSYLGAFLAITGAPVFLNNTFAVLFAVIAMGIAYYFRINAEEAMLENYFGNSYREYRQHTSRLIPFIW